jgi:hypothetical protein
MGYRTANKDVACTPFPTHTVEPKKTASGFLVAVPRTNLVPLTVLAAYEPLGLRAGDTVYAPLEYSKAPWGAKRLTVEGIEEFILVPTEFIYLIAVKPVSAPPAP